MEERLFLLSLVSIGFFNELAYPLSLITIIIMSVWCRVQKQSPQFIIVFDNPCQLNF
jgi:hypothetical protein